jgi:D-xylose transport system permease protein
MPIPDPTPTTARSFKPDLRLLSMVVILAGMWIFFRIVVGEFYFGGESIAKLSRDMASWTILAAGMTLVIISGNIDLSVGSLLALIAAFCALLMSPEYGPGWPPLVVIPLGMVLGALLGGIQGALIAYVRIPSFIVTLGGLFVFRGVTLKVSEFDPRIPGGTWVGALGSDYLSPTSGAVLAGGAGALAALLMVVRWIRKKKEGQSRLSTPLLIAGALLLALLPLGLALRMNAYHGIPLQTLVMAAVLFAMAVVARMTVFGRHLYAIGGNPEGARLAGIPVERRILGVYALMGFLAAVAGVIWLAQNQGSTKNGGTYYELYAIAAAVIGGSSMMGGRGTVFGTFLGGLVMATVVQGMDYTNLENWMQLVVRGGVLVLAVALDVASRSRPAWLRAFRRGRTND